MTLQEVFDLGDDRGEDMQQGDNRTSEAALTSLAIGAGAFAFTATHELSGGNVTIAGSIGGVMLSLALILAWRN
jgi:hypothetical protein